MCMHVTPKLCGKKFSMLVDTGASHTIFNYDLLADFLRKNNIAVQCTEQTVQYANNKIEDQVTGKADVILDFNGVKWRGSIYLVKNLRFEAIMGLDLMRALDVKIAPGQGTVEIADVFTTCNISSTQACSFKYYSN